MKTTLTLVLGGLCLVSFFAQAASPFAGSAYDVKVYAGANRFPASACVSFDPGGRFSITGIALTMRWDTQIDDETAFVAVTEPGDRVLVPYHMAVHGTALGDGRLVASGIDEFGTTFVFHGEATKACTLGARVGQATGDKAPVTNRTARQVGWVARLRVLDPCYAPPGWAVICDPVPSPYSVADTGDVVPRLAGRSFRLTLASTDDRVREYCWRFNADGIIVSTEVGRMTWAPEANATSRFHSVGAGTRPAGLGYHGNLVDDNLLQVVGIEARRGRSVVTAGFGQSVSACD